jgi:hypothetical protein
MAGSIVVLKALPTGPREEKRAEADPESVSMVPGELLDPYAEVWA